MLISSPEEYYPMIGFFGFSCSVLIKEIICNLDSFDVSATIQLNDTKHFENKIINQNKDNIQVVPTKKEDQKNEQEVICKILF